MNTLEDLRIFLKKKFEDRAILQNALAISLDVDQGSLSRFADGKTGIAGETVFKIMKYFDIQVLSPEEVPIMRRIGANAPEVQVDGENVVNVPVMAVAGAGAGQFNYALEPIDHIPILRDFIHPELFICKIEGNSMEPTIMPGACVGAIPPKRLREGVIYIFYDDVLGVVAKRLYYDGPGKLILVSDNKTVPPIPLDANGYEKVIIGEVIWVWHKFRQWGCSYGIF